MTIAGTGHRPDKLGGYSKNAQDKLYTIAKFWLNSYEVEKVISGVALGWDTALALAAIDLKIPLISAVPFHGQEIKWSDESQEAYRHILGKSKVVICSGGLYHSSKMHVRNKYMVDNASAILAMWDGSEGGTSNCISYAVMQNKPIHNLYDFWAIV